MAKHAVRITRQGIGHRVEVDGRDIADAVIGLSLEIRPPETFLTLTMLPGELDIEAEAHVRVDGKTAEALKALGWTPPDAAPEPGGM